MTVRMEGKVCVVTGGAGSLGLASAALLAREGGRVLLVDRDEERLEAARGTIVSPADRVAAVAADVSDAHETQAYLDRAVERWGKIDLLFSNAGVSGVVAPVTHYPDDVFDSVMAVNVRGAFLACKYGLPRMNDGGSIVVTSSVVGVTSDPGICAYATSKHAVMGLVRTVAKEAASRGIRVNVLAPGPIENSFQGRIEDQLTEAIGRNATELIDSRIPLGRHARAEEVAGTVLFLASDESSFSTGGVFMVDGGFTV
jgi:NAD(P)-dependent dehydrogenase (short-subunit alcohol dehydrogenase family)